MSDTSPNDTCLLPSLNTTTTAPSRLSFTECDLVRPADQRELGGRLSTNQRPGIGRGTRPVSLIPIRGHQDLRRAVVLKTVRIFLVCTIFQFPNFYWNIILHEHRKIKHCVMKYTYTRLKFMRSGRGTQTDLTCNSSTNDN